MAGYIGNIPVPQGTQTRQNFTATASQTSFPTIGYTAGFIDVYLNGVKLINGTDFTASNGSDVVLTTAASASDVLDVVIFDTFNTSSGTFSDTTLKNNVTLKNDTEEDGDGGRASKIIYQGEQSGGEISTLAEIQASHDGTADDQKGDLIFKTNDGSDNNAPTEAARIDSSRVFMVGTTNPNPTGSSVVGASIDASGEGNFSVDGAEALRLNRKSDVGEILNLRKDGTTVGSLGVQATGFYIDGEGGHAGIRFAGNEVSPRDNGSDADNTVSLGESDKRFKDLYLGGGIYLGGITSANFLDDYEEGEYTPLLYGYTTGSGTLLPLRSTHNVLSYTKVGRKVTVNGKIETSGSHSAQGSLLLSVPFTAANLTDQAGQGAGACFFYRTGQLHENPTVVFGEGVDYVYFFSNTSGGDVLGITADVMDAAIELIVGFTYFTT